MKSVLGSILLAFALSASVGHGQGVVASFTGGSSASDFAPTTTVPGISVGNLTPGADLTGADAQVNFPGNGAGYRAANWTSAVAPSDGSAWTFVVTALTGYQALFTEFRFRFKPSGSGPAVVRADADTPLSGRGFYPGGTNLPTEQDVTVDYVAAGEVALFPGQSLTLYVLGFGAQSASGTLLLDNIQLKGDVGPVPEPATATLLLAGLLLTLRRRSR